MRQLIKKISKVKELIVKPINPKTKHLHKKKTVKHFNYLTFGHE